VPAAKPRRPRASSGTRTQLAVKIDAFGPTAPDITALAERVAKDRAVKTRLAKTRYRLLYIDLVDVDDDAKVDRPNGSSVGTLRA
jgi:hypothetical protein